MYKPDYITKLDKISGLSKTEKEILKKVTGHFPFRSNAYYLTLIDWKDAEDPIRRIIIPDPEELENWGDLDPSKESHYKAVPGCEHKYRDTALLLVNDVCGGYCRFCFRKRLFMTRKNSEVIKNVTPGIEYIKDHPEINNVLLTGGDPLLLSTKKLEKILRRIREIDHVDIIRIGTKIPSFDPFRIINDKYLPEMLSKYSTTEKKIYVMTHFNHPRELTGLALEGIDILHRAGVLTANQTPFIRGVNDDPETLRDLFNSLAYAGIPPYYVFICRPTLGNLTYTLPIENCIEIFDKARILCSGLAKRARLALSHASGKIDVLGMNDENVFFKFHRAAHISHDSNIIICRRNPEAYWFDDYDEAIAECLIDEAEDLIEIDNNFN
ncbi:MAG: KamA family radical SAM protein [bacterium]|nr:KamA family radical SAM protein [bacterium]